MICDKLLDCSKEQFAKKKVSGCINNPSICIEASDRRSKLKCEERRKKYVLENTKKNHVISYKMDGGIIVQDQSVPKGTCKCDYLFLVNDVESSAILIELKGVDVKQALKQLHGVLMLFGEFLKTLSHTYGRIIVASSVPNLKANPEYVNLYKKLRNSFHGNIKIVEREFIEKDTELHGK